jgi:uncharacterized protein
MMKTESFSIPVSDSIGAVSAELMQPAEMKALMVLAHGAGAGMNHAFMKALSKSLAGLGIGTIRFNFSYMEKGKKMPDPPAIAEKTVSSVLEKAHTLFPDVPLIAGGKSFGGRMTSQLVARQAPAFLKGIAFYGFPLHAMGKPSTDRAAHLARVQVPMLFLQGTKDALAAIDLITEVVSTLPAARLDVFEGADHSFKAGKKDLVPELSSKTLAWFESL